ncbi:MAG: dephospho-CoA kinase [Dehalococcoidales bacterium]|jgi:dephospho-CoA kinase|nr:dephospho-CoA kinase [Dehalococcoidales bacterium]MDP6576451.1 dephospho-CoA kinase [Dehalococcoidales bacterium]
MKVIGLTGGIGSGKSTIAQFLAELGAVIINADEVGHEVSQSGTDVWREVVAAFGSQVITHDKVIDREKLATIIFNDAEARVKLNRIMHPPIYRMVRAQIDRYRRQGIKVVVLEAPLLLEVGWTSLVDEVWVTTTDETKVLERLRKRSGLSESAARARIRSQLPSKERIKHTDVAIDNDGNLAELKIKVEELWENLQV